MTRVIVKLESAQDTDAGLFFLPYLVITVFLS